MIAAIKKYSLYLILFIVTCNFIACNNKPTAPALFDVLDENKTGLSFANKLTPTADFNVFDYMYYYNGGGIGVGDFNNDGLIDVFFAANQSNNKIYLNEGKLHFKDITAASEIPQDSAWSTGVSVVDINNDGLLDIYVCRLGKLKSLNSHNQLLICTGIDKNGVPHYKDEAAAYGLDFQGFSTQAVFFDFDGDGDLDMFLLNHTIHDNGTFGDRKKLLATFNAYTGDRMYRNEGNNKFTDITKNCGINSSVIGYGLGVAVADINLDGYPDLYVGNDFHENDYMYINQHNGTFKEELNEHVMHTSQFTMGVDIADVNNDGYPEIISMDMMPYDNYILKRSEGEDDYDLFYEKLKYGYNYQYTRNNLQYNRKNGMFSETGMYSGVFATDWSWAPLWMDFDNDGLKDLFISNGIPKRLNDIDYINFVSNEEVQNKIRNKNLDQKDMGLIDKFPQIKIPNKFFKNNGSLLFSDIESRIGNNQATYSNGAVYADFDNDGDLDVMVNNIDAPALLYENKSNDKKDKAFVDVKLKGAENNINAIGAKIILFANGGIRTYEKYPVHGFLSSMEIPLHIGLDKTTIDSAFLIWPDNTFQAIQFNHLNTAISFIYQKGLPKFNYGLLANHWPNPTRPMKDVTKETALNYFHQENDFQEFNREPLLPHMLSSEGPGLAIGDINHDGLEDVFIGSSKRNKSAVFLQQSNGKFIRSKQLALDNDSTYEDVDAAWVDVNNDGNIDLVVASGGNEYFGQDKYLMPRVYLNDGKANFTKQENAFGNLFINASCVIPYDFNGDGFTDLFIGGRSVPYEYGKTPNSYLLQNDGKGNFKDVTNQLAKELSEVGFVTQAIWFDIDKDGDKDLIVALEWGGIVAFINNHGHFIKKVLSDKKGWWNFILPCDLDNDGNIDIIAGNLGLNNRLRNASDAQPIRLYYNDFDHNGKKEQLLTYYLNGKEIPFANLKELQKQMPVLKKHFLYADDFAKASLDQIFNKEDLAAADVLSANYFANSILLNKGNLNFETKPMPWEAQLSPFKDAVIIDANGDNLPDILLFGNYYDNNIQMGRYDADFGTILLNKGHGEFAVENINGLSVKGQVRHVKKINIGNKESFILAKNNDSTMVIRFNDKIKK